MKKYKSLLKIDLYLLLFIFKMYSRLLLNRSAPILSRCTHYGQRTSVSQVQCRSLTTASNDISGAPHSNTRGFILGTALFLGGASAAYYLYAKEEAVLDSTYKRGSSYKNTTERGQETREEAKEEAKETGKNAYDHAYLTAQSAKKAAHHSAEMARDSLHQTRQKAKAVSEASLSGAANLKDSAVQQAKEARKAIDRFANEHHMKSGTRRPEDVVASAHDLEKEITLRQDVKQWTEEKAEEAAKKYKNFKNKAAAETYRQKEEAKNAKEEAAKKIESVKESAKENAENASIYYKDVKENVKSRANDVTEKAFNAAKEEKNHLESRWKSAKETVEQDIHYVADKAKEGVEDLQSGWVDIKEEAELLKDKGKASVKNGYVDAKDKVEGVKQWVKGGIEGVEKSVHNNSTKAKESANELAADIKSTMREHVVRGEGWAEEEADNLHPTRKATLSSDRATEKLHEHPKPAEVVVEEAH
ncbi:hypothetical protein BDF14DRAFT_1770757 [Spinellus fusiger]|nr:hypothetical protein BDF14DRAFT_1770757 [Spinellus fusiger]